MKPPPPDKSDELELALQQSKVKRKTQQLENKEEYTKALKDLATTVHDEEGPEMRERLMQARRNWFTEELGKGRFPEDLKGYYDMLNVSKASAHDTVVVCEVNALCGVSQAPTPEEAARLAALA